ncbi:MAG TPA: adenylate/guanylate cyclase domain-containing protein [Chthoniobacterales bacterium]|nr:adenylate/guanylate cyclase domain-containing protein [Chthoniobacterales bacterium]
MMRLSIRRQIIGIAIGLIVLMACASVLSMLMARREGDRLKQLTTRYIPAYGNLARANIRSLERAVAFRRMVIDSIQAPADEARFAADRSVFDAKGAEVVRELQAARTLLEQGGVLAMALARIDSRIEVVLSDYRRHLNEEIERLLPLLGTGDSKGIAERLARVDERRDELTLKLDGIRSEMLDLVRSDSAATLRNQHQVFLISVVLTALAALLGLVFATLVSTGMTRPVRRLLEGTRAVEAGKLDETIVVTSTNEIGQLTAAFNRMVEQLRLKEHIRQTFGKYVDPRIVESLIDRPALAAAEGQRRVMTILFCDMKGFTGVSEGMTPQGLVKVMNRYLSTMSEPIRTHGGIIDKYIGDAIMAYWGPPFVEEAQQARLACLAALDMAGRIELLRAEIAEVLGVRAAPIAFDLRMGIATGDALVGSIGSEFMKSYTVMGDTVNLASRLEAVNKIYGTRLLAIEATVTASAGDIEAREIDRIVVLGQSQSQAIFEVMGRKGELTPEQDILRTRFAAALAAYRARSWDEARRAFLAAQEAAPGDGPSMTFLKRLDSLQAHPPGDGWDGAWRLDEK